MHKWRDQKEISILGIIVLSILAIGTLAVVGSGSLIATPAAVVSSPFNYYFSVPGTLNEASSMDNTTSPYWWLNSGGALILSDGKGQTIQGDASSSNYWRTLYAITNPTDTDKGLHPQNLFRLVSRSKWDNLRAEGEFYIAKDNLSSSPNRNASNGLLFMSRYGDEGQTLYYSGIRVDGTAVIKKKYKGSYYTMGQKKVFPGTYGSTSENLLPHNKWIALRSDTVTNAGGTVTVTLSMKVDGTWQKLLEVTDTGSNFGSTPPITEKGYGGIRTDFMDVKFDNIKFQDI